MNKKRIFLSSPHMSDEGYELDFVKEAFATNWIAPLGLNVDGFEKELAERVGASAAVALSSGTAAIHLALRLAGVSNDDVVICQSLTFSASANPIMYQNATPVFVDSENETWNMDPVLLEEALIKYPNAKAVIAVHLYGVPGKIDEIRNLCTKYNVALIEDAAESLGSTALGQETGTFGDYGIYSFNGNKIITTSGGGMLVSKQLEAVNKARFWATQSRDAALHYQHSELGFNYRMSNVVAGIGRGQLKVLNQRIERKKAIRNIYFSELSTLPGVSFQPYLSTSSPNFWLTAITIRGSVSPLEIMQKLEAENIESRPVWKPMHLQPFFENFDFIGNGTSELLFEEGVCLPSDSKMTDDDVHRVCDVIKGLWK